MTALYQLSTQCFHFPYMKLSRFFGLLGSLVFLAIVPSCENPIATEEPQVEKETKPAQPEAEASESPSAGKPRVPSQAPSIAPPPEKPRVPRDQDTTASKDRSRTSGPAELNLSAGKLLETPRTSAYPSTRLVLNNPPSFLHPIEGLPRHSPFKDLRHHFRLSQSSEFDGDIIQSPSLRWALFTPHQHLTKGKWFWQYGTSRSDTAKIDWQETREISITGNENQFLAPAFSEWSNKLGSTRPRYLAQRIGISDTLDQVGYNYDNYLKKVVRKQEIPNPIYFADSKEIAKRSKKLNERSLQLFIGKRSKEKFQKIAEQYINQLKGYIITGDELYAKEALRQFRDIRSGMARAKKDGIKNDFFWGDYHFLEAQSLDTIYNFLSKEERQEIIADLVAHQQKDFAQMLGVDEYKVGSSHFWQHHFRNFFSTSIILYGETPEADDWINYCYQIVLFGWPANTRSTDGGWGPGNGYFGANIDTLFLMPFWLSQYTGTDFFQIPWYKNLGRYIATTSPPHHHSQGGFGDASNMRHGPAMTTLASAMRLVSNDPFYDLIWNSEWAGKQSLPLDQQYQARKRFAWFLLPLLDNKISKVPQVWPKASLYPTTGTVAMHSDLENLKSNTMVTMKSAPNGCLGHAHASQNAFNISYAGEPVFYRTGYYTSWADKHTLNDYRHTRAHNSILVDGNGQLFSTSGYGWIARFLDGKEISYTLGDASNAYTGEILRKSIQKEVNIIKADTSSFAKESPVTRFRRHLTFLHPNTVVIYDELEASKPVEWTFNLRAPKGLMQTDGSNVISVDAPKATGTATVFSHEQTTLSVNDQWVEEPTDWKGNLSKYWKGDKDKIANPPKQWQGNATTKKVKANRFLTIIEVTPKGGRIVKPEDVTRKNSKLTYIKHGNWQISAQLNPSQPAQLTIRDAKHSKGLSYHADSGEFKLGTQTHSAPQGATIIVEDGKAQSIIDQAPERSKFN